jgi:16S rRNA (adenine(1408)-N(1))-methyltransferase
VDRGGLANALFVVAAVESPPVELVGRADLVTVVFPWGSLLRGVLGLDARAAAGLASLVRPGGALEALVSVIDRDGLTEPASAMTDRRRLEEAWSALGFAVEALRAAGTAELAASGSSWAKRLGVGPRGRRSVDRLVLRRLAQDERADRSSRPAPAIRSAEGPVSWDRRPPRAPPGR